MESKIIEFSWPLVWDWAIQLIALLVIIWILKKLLFKPVSEFLDKRQALIASDLDHANTAKVQAEELKKEYELKLHHINEEADEILKEARAKAHRREEEIITHAKEEAEAIKAKALQDMALEQERVKDQIKKEMIEVAGLMSAKFVASAMDEDKQEELITEIIKEMGDVEWLI